MKLLTKIVNKLFLFKLFPLGLRIFALAFFAFLMIVGFSATGAGTKIQDLLYRTNLANLIVWAYWWPGIVIAAVIFGRVWCIVCPVELVTTLCSRIGLKLKAPAFLRSGWAMTLLYGIILMLGVETFNIDLFPVRMAIYLVILLVFSIIAGLIFEKNTFCRCLCPVGHLLGLYSRLSAFAWKVRHPEICAKCTDHSCIANSNAYKIEGRSCGIGLVPTKLDDNTECLLCGQCLKACDMNNPGIAGRPNPGWTTRKFASDLLSLKTVSNSEIFFLLIVAGFLMSEVLGDWADKDSILMYLPTILHGRILSFLPEKLIELTVVILVYPFIIWSIPFAFFKIFKGKMNFMDFLRNAAILSIPILAICHACKAIVEMTEGAPYIPLALLQPRGIETAGKIIDKSITVGGLPDSYEKYMMIFILFMLIGSIAFSVFLTHRLNKKTFSENTLASYSFYLIPLIYGGILVTSVVIWKIL